MSAQREGGPRGNEKEITLKDPELVGVHTPLGQQQRKLKSREQQQLAP